LSRSIHLTLSSVFVVAASVGAQPTASTEFRPLRYVCERAPSAPAIDGRLDDPVWRRVPWTEDFVDIEGDRRPKPALRTRARMAWDEAAFYVAAELVEPHVWATLTRRDSVIFRDDDFEVFIDPDGDTHAYCELEINSLGTEWDLLLVRPYRDGGPAVHGWDIAGLRSAVFVDGSLNHAADRDRGWSIEIAIPWAALAEAAGTRCPPRPGDVWRVNFSRVDWTMDVRGSGYTKRLDPGSGRPLAEDNWVWSPQGVINMHCPESWGLVLFADGPDQAWPEDLDAELAARAALRRVYHAQRARDEFTDELQILDLDAPTGLGAWSWPPRLAVTPSSYEAVLVHRGGRDMHLTADGRVWIRSIDR
jgi:hypothetical protein